MIDICQLSIEISAFLSMHRTIYVGIDVQVIHQGRSQTFDTGVSFEKPAAR